MLPSPVAVAAAVHAAGNAVGTTMFGLSTGAMVAEGLVAGTLGALLTALVLTRRNRFRDDITREAEQLARRELAARQLLEQQRADERATIAAAVSVLSLGVVVIGTDGNEVLRNDVAAAVLGSPEQTDTRSDGEVMAGGTLRRLLERASGGQRGREPLEIIGPPRRSFVLSAEPVGEPVHGNHAVVGTVTDVSEQRRADAMREDFITNVSHELRTPVGAVAILAETLSAETDPANVARLTARLESEAHRLSAMVDDLLALGRVESGGAGDELVPVPELIDEAIERARASAESRHLSVEVNDVGHGLAVHGDRRQLVSALHNLLENALKYSDKGKAVQVGASSRRDDATGATRIAITVTDHGIGIPTRDRERVFERFYRVDRARARDTGGSGLGLAIVRHVTRNHNGEVSVQSIEGEGSTFTLVLPGVLRNSPNAHATASSNASMSLALSGTNFVKDPDVL